MNTGLPLVRDLQQQEFLHAFMESETCPQHTMNFFQLDGYLRAICCDPAMAKPEDWLPLVFADKQPGYRGDAEAAQVLAAIMNLYHFHAWQVLNGKCDLPCAPTYHTRREERINLEQWTRGFMQGYILRGDNWNKLLGALRGPDQEIFTEKFDHFFDIITVVADVDLALQQGSHADSLAGIFATLPEALVGFGNLGRALAVYPVK